MLDYSSNPKAAIAVANNYHAIMNHSNTKEYASEFLGICKDLADGDFEPFVYEELRSNLNLSYPSDLEDYVSFFKNEKDFLNQQTSDVVAPLSWIMFKLESEYQTAVKEISDFSIQLFVHAYDIARKNKDSEGNNYLGEFYSGLREILDTNPADVDLWAQTIVEGFVEDDGIGIMREAA